jgi:hypothetical protein
MTWFDQDGRPATVDETHPGGGNDSSDFSLNPDT